MRADFYSHCAETLMGDYWAHTLLWAFRLQLQAVGCCSAEVDAGLLAVS